MTVEGEVARLYERRQRWEVNREALLDEVIGSAPIEPQEDFAYLHLFARPVVPDEDFLDRAREEQQAGQFLSNLVSGATDAVTFLSRYEPDLSGNYNFERRADGWVTRQGLDEHGNPYHDPSMVLSMQVNLDGGGHLFCGGVAELYDNNLLIFEVLVAGLTTKFLAVMGRLYTAGAYLGPVDVGLAVTGIRGGISDVLRNRRGVRPYAFDKDDYRRTDRFLASALENDPRSAARSLVFPLIRATTRDSYDPFVD